MYFHYFALSPLGKGCGPSLEQPPKEALCQVRLKLAQWVHHVEVHIRGYGVVHTGVGSSKGGKGEKFYMEIKTRGPWATWLT